ncbi:hypothetical protein RRG08_050782 [Elysia crispata]|uniref:Uncharacterized protein n=1 Tax=Elysia crispata TaxID=231223 RepID=A0AAE0YGV1_9GAST|nr:hypothetical protein RRG08_050782 [Elysia crispata]
MVKCNNSRFEARVQQTCQLHSLWWSDKDIAITEVSASSCTDVHDRSSSASSSPLELDGCIPPTRDISLLYIVACLSSSATAVSIPTSSDTGNCDQDVSPPPSIAAGPCHSFPSTIEVVSSSDALSLFYQYSSCKEKKLYTCPVCKILDNHMLKMICCDKPGCDQCCHGFTSNVLG